MRVLLEWRQCDVIYKHSQLKLSHNEQIAILFVQ